jgi:hypothetical protein
MKTGRVVITDPQFIGPLYYIKEDNCLANHAGPLTQTTFAKDEATLVTEREAFAILESFYNTYMCIFGYETLDQMSDDGITIQFEGQ